MSDVLEVVALGIGYSIMLIGGIGSAIGIGWLIIDYTVKALGLFPDLMRVMAVIYKERRAKAGHGDE